MSASFTRSSRTDGRISAFTRFVDNWMEQGCFNAVNQDDVDHHIADLPHSLFEWQCSLAGSIDDLTFASAQSTLKESHEL